MKKPLLLIFFVIIANSFSVKAACTVGDLISQWAIDNFSKNYPGCTEVTNGFNISGVNITNLDGLLGVTSIGGLTISDNPRLTDLSGLSMLKSSGALNIVNNPMLADLSGLSQLETVGYIDIENNSSLVNLSGLGNLVKVGNFRVVFNAALTSVAGAGKLTAVDGNMSIGGNPLLENLSGLENITSVGDALMISLSDKMKDVSGLIGLKALGGFLYIGNNLLLSDLSGLANLLEINGYIKLENNPALTGLAGLDNISSSGISFLQIFNCTNLSVCGVKSICTYLNGLSNNLPVQLEGNASGCQTKAEILNSNVCQEILPVNLISFSGKSTLEGNQMTWTTTWEQNNAGFHIEKSANAIKFDQIGFVDGAGTSNRSNTYSFTDVAPEKVTYYRLKQVDLDNSSSYSRIIVVKRTENKQLSKEITVYPNPSTGQLFVKASNDNLRYSIQTLNGETIKEGSVVSNKPIATSSLQNGLYLIKVGKEVMKVVVNN
ncbi:T9SS type A sorting domain-containing protein [Dyadobacter sp. LJ419]|uniref:T9SS type A sorting domain-containing protein n=2 Tax=Dyadobacter chenwenxiniae TaxID=2906456 RepID=A0A9X1PPG7_9BACT|nr:T9SS type A sorting domain-containing protein [Dyadobacter chenwenxiniae]MCF0065057.1 T9SS type A sorting domain-containing protein [Dyadobacter chenwenxiniae]